MTDLTLGSMNKEKTISKEQINDSYIVLLCN